MSPLTISLDAAHNLVGLDLPEDWKVVEKVMKDHTSTGGHFSVSYLVDHKDGRRAFLKVLDLAKALALPGDQLRNIENLIKQFNFERDVSKPATEVGNVHGAALAAQVRDEPTQCELATLHSRAGGPRLVGAQDRP